MTVDLTDDTRTVYDPWLIGIELILSKTMVRSKNGAEVGRIEGKKEGDEVLRGVRNSGSCLTRRKSFRKTNESEVYL